DFDQREAGHPARCAGCAGTHRGGAGLACGSKVFNSIWRAPRRSVHATTITTCCKAGALGLETAVEKGALVTRQFNPADCPASFQPVSGTLSRLLSTLWASIEAR